MKRLVEFKLHNGKLPYFIEERLPYLNGPSYIGITFDDKDCYVPKTLIDVTEEDLTKRVKDLNMESDSSEIQDDKKPKKYHSDKEKQKMAEDWINQKCRT